MKGVTLYTGLAKFYFRYLLQQIIAVGKLDRSNICILDFGCGEGELKKLVKGGKLVGYDLIPELSDVPDWRQINFDVLVANEVFYCFDEEALGSLLQELKIKNLNLELIVGISKQGLLNNIGKYLLGRPDAHAATKICPKKEIEILMNYCQIIDQKSVLGLANVYALRFKK